MPNTIIERYDAYKAMGHNPAEAAGMLGFSRQEARAAEHPAGQGYDEATVAAFGMATNSLYTPAQLAYATQASKLNLTMDDMFPEGVKNKREWWKPIVESAIAIGDTLATPQQLMWQAMMNIGDDDGDWRKAIPEWAAPDDWKKQGVEHELIMIGDVVDDYIGGKYHALLGDLDKKGGIAKYGGGWGLKVAEFLADVATDPMNIVIGAGIGKKLTKELRRALPKAVQIEHGIRAAAKSRSLGDYQDVRRILGSYIDDLEAEAMGVPTKETGRKLALARTAADQIDDEIDYLSAVARNGDEVALPPVNRTKAVDKPGENATTAEKVAWAVQKETDDAISQPVRFEDLDNEALFKRLVFGPDDSEMLGAAILRVMKGEDPRGLLVRGLLDNVNPASTNLEIAITGIGKNGMITKEMASNLEAFEQIAAMRRGRLEKVVQLKTQLRDAAKAAADAAKPRALADNIKAGEDLVAELSGKAVAAKNELVDLLTRGRARVAGVQGDLGAAKKLAAGARKPSVVDAGEISTARELVADVQKRIDAVKARVQEIHNTPAPKGVNKRDLIAPHSEELKALRRELSAAKRAAREAKKPVLVDEAALDAAKKALNDVQVQVARVKQAIREINSAPVTKGVKKADILAPHNIKLRALRKELAAAERNVRKASKPSLADTAGVSKADENLKAIQTKMDEVQKKIAEINSTPAVKGTTKSELLAPHQKELRTLRDELAAAEKLAKEAKRPKVNAAELEAGEAMVSDLSGTAAKTAADNAAAVAAKRAELARLNAELAEAKKLLAEAKSPNAKVIDDEAVKAANEAVEAIQKNLDEAINGAKATSAEIRHFKKYGVFSSNATDNLGIKAPSGPRRDIFSAADFVDNTRFGMRMFTAGLYPGSVFPNVNSLFVNRMFREPMRVLEQNLPGAWEVVRGGQRAKEAFVKGSYGKLRRIYEDAGVLETQKAPGIVKTVVGSEMNLKHRVNKERDELLYKLLDTDPADGAYATLVAQADEKLLKGVEEMRAFFNQIAPRLGMPDSKRISFYMPHVIKDSMFAGGKMPREFIGVKKINGVPWFMKDRVGSEFHLTSATETLDIYVRGVAKYLYTDPSMDMLQKMANNAGRLDPSKTWLAGYASDIISNVRGDPSSLSNMLKVMGFGELEDPARKLAATLGSLTYSAALAGNIRYPIMSIVQAINTTAAEYGMMRTLKGMAAQMTAKGKLISKAAGVAEQHVAHFEDLQGAWARTMSEIRIASPMSISDTENFIRGLTFHTSMDERLSKLGYRSLNEVKDKGHFREIIAQAVRDSEDINHVFGTFGKPVAFGRFSRTGSALATQFMSFPVKQTETIISNSFKNPGFLVDYLLISGQMQSVIGRANLDVSPFLGTGYFDATKRDISSLPIDVIGSAVMAFTAIFDYDMPITEKERLYEDFKRNAAMLIPGQRAYQNTKNTLTELASGEVRDKRTGALQRKLNFSVVNDDPIYGQGSEWLSVLTRVKSKQGKMKEDADRIQRLNSAQRAATSMAIVKEANAVFREGKALDMKKVHQLEVDLSRLGIPIGTTDLVSILVNEEKAHVLIERLRDNPMEAADEFRVLDDHKFYQGARY